MWNAAIYARLSRTDKSKTLSNQINGLKEYAENKSINIYKIYEDDGYSGDDLDRPSFLMLLNDMGKKKFNVVLVKDISRLGRNLYKVGKLIEIVFPANNIRLISVNDNYDSLMNCITDNIIFKNFFNQYYLKEYKSKINRSLNERAIKEDLCTVGKYGYLLKNNKMIIDVESSKVVEMIFDMAKKGYKINDIVIVLNNNRILTRSMYKNKVLKLKQVNVSKKWSYSMVWSILNDIEYCGYAENFKYSKKKNILIDGAHIGIVSKDLYNDVLRMKKIRGNYKCEQKDNIISLIKVKNIRYLYHGRVNHKYYCNDNGFIILIYSFHDLLYKSVIKYLFDNDIEKYIMKEYKKINKLIQNFEKEFNKLSNLLTNNFEEYCMEIIDYQKYEYIKNSLELKIKYVKNKILLLNNKFYNFEECCIYIKKFCFDLVYLQKEVVEFIKKFIHKIFIDKVQLKTYNINIVLKII